MRKHHDLGLKCWFPEKTLLNTMMANRWHLACWSQLMVATWNVVSRWLRIPDWVEGCCVHWWCLLRTGQRRDCLVPHISHPSFNWWPFLILLIQSNSGFAAYTYQCVLSTHNLSVFWTWAMLVQVIELPWRWATSFNLPPGVILRLILFIYYYVQQQMVLHV